MASASFPRAARLLKPRDFARLRTRSRRVGARYFSAEVAAGDSGMARLGLAVSKRVSKNAVVRNRIKRIARNSFRQIRRQLPTMDILLIARSGAEHADNAQLHAELERLWRRITTTLNGTQGIGTMRD
ncbi:MAG: ribonuclease P protein component [Rhodanobacter sp.]|jgi:ribonuclease P protein component|nr:ribonuclease P protein component [Rhodanobacter sp.]